MAVPLLDLTLQNAPLVAQFREVFDKTVATSSFILGPKTETFESNLAKTTATAFTIGVSSGTDALLLAMMALGIGPGDEVITSPFTFFATAGCISRLGAVPKFIDIDPVSFNLNPALLEQALTKKTKAIMPVHLFGLCADMDPILAFAKKHNLFVIEDAAQAIGAKDKGRPAGSMGHIGALSFYPTKNLGALGDAGACSTNDPALAKQMKKLRVHGGERVYFHDVVGANFRIDALQAAFLDIKLPHLPAWEEGRRANAAFYDAAFAGLPLVTPKTTPGMHHIYNQYTLRIPDGKREAFKTHLAGKGIGHGVYYPLPLHLQQCFAYLGYKQGDFPQSEKAANEVVSIPVYPELTGAQKQEVAQAITSFFRA